MSTQVENTEHGHDGHPPHLAHHFDNAAQQFDAAVQGMWLFLATEILLFAGLFCAYAVFRATHPEIFVAGHKYLSVKWGAINTIILICSSFTIATGVWAVQRGRTTLLSWMLALTILGGLGFLSIKYVEYKEKWQHGLLWGKHYQPQEHGAGHADESAGAAGAGHGETPVGMTGEPEPGTPGTPPPVAATQSATTEHAATPQAGATESHAATTPATAPGGATTATASGQPPDAEAAQQAFQPPSLGPQGLAPPATTELLEPEQQARNVQTFFAVYFIMTGLHGLHVIAGIAAISWLLFRSLLGHFSAAYFTPVPLVGLYWHVVDLVWIYLFPLLYLIH